MANELPDFPVVLHKDGVKRTAHSAIAYNQLRTQGFTEGGAKSASKRSQAKSRSAKTESK